MPEPYYPNALPIPYRELKQEGLDTLLNRIWDEISAIDNNLGTLIAGGYNSLNDRIKSEGYNVRDNGATGDGTTDDSNAIAAVDVIAAAAGKALVIPPGTYRFTQNKTLTSHIIMMKGAIFSGTVTITMPMPEAGEYQIFDTNLLVTFTGGNPVRPEWWGAKGDGVTNDTTAFTKMVSSIPVGGRLLLRKATYLLTSTITLPAYGVTISGHGVESIWKFTGTGYAIVTAGTSTAKQTLRDFHINGGSLTSGRHGINTSGHTTYVYNVVIQFMDIGIRIDSSSVLVKDNYLIHLNTGVRLDTLVGSTQIVGNQVTDCAIAGVYLSNDASNTVIRDNIFDAVGAGKGVWVDKVATMGLVIEGNRFEGCNGGSILLEGYSSAFYLKQVSIGRNTFTGSSGSYSILLKRVLVANMIGNSFNSTAEPIALRVENTSVSSKYLWLHNLVLVATEFSFDSNHAERGLITNADLQEVLNNRHQVGFSVSDFTNVVLHSSFEDAHYLVASGTNPPTIAQDTTVGHSDSFSARVIFPTGGSGFSFSVARVDNTLQSYVIGDYFLISFSAKADAAGASIQALWTGTAGNESVTFTTKTSWERYTFATSLTTVNGSNSLRFFLSASVGSPLTLWIDDVQVIKNPANLKNSSGIPYIPTLASTRTVNSQVLTAAFGANLGKSSIKQLSLEPYTTQTLAASATIQPVQHDLPVAGSGGAVTLTSTPSVAAGTTIGERILIVGTSNTNTLTIQDVGTLPNSGVRLAAATRVLGNRDSLLLRWDGTTWNELQFTNVL